MLPKSTGLGAFVVLVAGVALAGCDGWIDESADTVDITTLDPADLADHLVLETDSYRLDQAVQEGGAAGERMVQDAIQSACSIAGEPDAATARKVAELARASYTAPPGGPRLGSWRRGSELARSGFGFRVGHRTDDHDRRDPGGNCYACHQMDPAEVTYGTLGPSLVGYGRERGTDAAVVSYLHELITNPHQYFPCTNMPRFGAQGVLTEEQISHIMAYLLDPESPVNE